MENRSSDAVGLLLETGEQASAARLYGGLLRGGELSVLIYNGVFDMDCNFVGTDTWLTALTDGLVGTPYANFSSRPRTPWTIHQ